MTEMFGEAWPPMSVPDLAPDDDDESPVSEIFILYWLDTTNVQAMVTVDMPPHHGVSSPKVR